MTVMTNVVLVLKDSQGNEGIVKTLTDKDIIKIADAITDVGQVVDPATHMPIEATTASVGVVQLATAQDIENGTAGKVVDAKELNNFAQTLPAANGITDVSLGDNSNQVIVSKLGDSKTLTIDNVEHASNADEATHATQADTATSANSVAWSNVSGKPNTFAPSTHNHDDRYYTESEIDTKLSGKSDTTHNHNSAYLGITAKATSASIADKLSTARSISLGNYDFQGSANFDGSANITLNATPYNCRVSQGNTNNFPYHYIGTTGLISGVYVDCSITLLVTSDFIGGGYGIISIILRTNGSGADSSCEARWLVRSVLPEDTIQVGLIKTSGKSYLDIYYKTTGTYQCCIFRCLGAGGRGSISRKFTLVDSSEVSDTTTSNSKTSVGAYTSVNNGGLALRGSAYSSVVSATDSGNVNYAKSAGAVAWSNVSGKPSSYTPASHTHNYAGSSSAGGKATSAAYADSAGSVAWGNVSGRPDIWIG